jgi:hypothetical protein
VYACTQLRRWLLTQECTLFKYRFRKLQPSAQSAFLVENSLPYQPLPASEFTAVKDKLETIHRVRARPIKTHIEFQAAYWKPVATITRLKNPTGP